MKALIDFIPLLLFLILYRTPPRDVLIGGQTVEIGGITSATVVLLVVSIVLYGGLWLRQQRRLDLAQWATLLLSLLFGGLTLIFNNEAFFKWKAPVLHWAFAAGFLASRYLSDGTPLIQRILGRFFTLPIRFWQRLNTVWVIYFVLGGLLQLYVAFTFQNFWVEFKVFGSPIFCATVLLAQITATLLWQRRQRATGTVTEQPIP